MGNGRGGVGGVCLVRSSSVRAAQPLTRPRAPAAQARLRRADADAAETGQERKKIINFFCSPPAGQCAPLRPTPNGPGALV